MKKIIVAIVALTLHILFYNFLAQEADTGFFADFVNIANGGQELFLFILRNLGTMLCDLLVVGVISMFYSYIRGALKFLGLA